MSSFRGIDLFGSGPHRFSLGPQGLQILPNGVIFGSDLLPGFQAIGPTETQVLVTGRLVAPTDTALWGLRNSIVAEADADKDAGELADGRGRTWADMWLVDYSEEDHVDRGRLISIGYVATFRRLTVI
jgi:hypothetical protein